MFKMVVILIILFTLLFIVYDFKYSIEIRNSVLGDVVKEKNKLEQVIDRTKGE